MGKIPRSGDARSIGRRAAAFDSRREASACSTGRNDTLPTLPLRTGKARRTSLDRLRSRRQEDAAVAVPSASIDIPATRIHSDPESVTRSPSPIVIPSSRSTPHRDIPASLPSGSYAYASPIERTVSRFESATVHRNRQPTTVRTPAGRRAQPSTITRRAPQRAVSRSAASAFQSSNATRDKSESGSQHQKPDRELPKRA